jgi:hypothetical protein
MLVQSIVAFSLSASPAPALQGLHHRHNDETGKEAEKNFKRRVACWYCALQPSWRARPPAFSDNAAEQRPLPAPRTCT